MKKGIFISLVIAVLLFSFYSLGTFQVFDRYLYDSYQNNIQLGDNNMESIIVVAIDDLTLDRSKIWPFPRSMYADLVRVLNNGGASVIAFDINFDSYSGYSEKEDRLFAKEIKDAGNVVLARDYYMEKGEPVIRNPIKLFSDNAVLAMVDPVLDDDSFIRRYRLLAYHDDETLLYFALQVYLLHEKISAGSMRVVDRSLQIGDIQIPLDRDGSMLVNYSAVNKGVEVVPFAHVIRKEFLELNPDYFKDKIVLVGSTASYLQDSFPTPVDLNMPGVLIHANAIRTIMGKEYISSLYHLNYLWLVVLSVMSVFLLTVMAGSLLGFIGVGSLLASSMFVVREIYIRGVYIELAVIIAAIVSAYLLGFFMNFLKVRDERTRVKGVFKQYVSPNIVDRFVSGEEDMAEAGKERIVSVLFADIIGFTTFCEDRPPAQVVAQLNEILDVLTEEVFKYKGTLDKFIGDELMAVWGSPVEQLDHAELAVKCAVTMKHAVAKLQEKWKLKGAPILDVGVSISSGQVIAGNIGAKKYKDYTVIGDVVNSASRLQSLTREGYSIVIGEQTKELVEDIFVCENIGDVKVKGKKQKLSAWAIA